MAIYTEFDYHKPASVDEVLKLVAKYKGQARILNGGTDLVNKIKEGFDSPAALIDIKSIEVFKILEIKENRLHIGACVTFTELIESELIKKNFPLLWEASTTVASVGTRNRATIVGNICSAVPSLDSGPALLNYEAVVIAQNRKSKREIKIANWFKGPKKTALKKGEIVTGIEIPLIAGKQGSSYQKLGRYTGEDLAQAGVAVLALDNKQFRVAVCAVGPVPKRLTKIENRLNGNEITDSLIEKIRKLLPAQISPITDIRSTKEYRTHMIKVMFGRGLKKAVEDIK